MKYIGMAVTQRAAANSMQMFEGDAKLRKTLVLATIVASNNPSEDDPDPLDWSELDSLMSKPPTKERNILHSGAKARRQPYKSCRREGGHQ